MFVTKTLIPALVAISVGFGATAEVTIKPEGDRLRVSIDDKLFTEYYFTNVPRPFCHPVLAPGQLQVNRSFPMQRAAGEETDHKHHRGLWFAHGNVNGNDFWSEDGNFGRIVHREFVATKSGAKSGSIESLNDWVTANGEVICQDQRELRFSKAGKGADEVRVLDFSITLMASKTDLVFGDTKEGSMAIRVAESMRVKGGLNQGHIRNSVGMKDGAAWGKQASWCDYSGPVNAQTVGITVLDHDQNPRHPTWWHVRDYGLFAANPFGRHDFEGLKDQPKAGDLMLAKGEKVTFRYRFVFHRGDVDPKQAESWYKRFVK